MLIKTTIDAELYIDNGNISFVTYDPEGDVQFKHDEPIYELVSKFTSMYQIPGTEKFKLTPACIEEFEQLKHELDDSLTLINTILEEHS